MNIVLFISIIFIGITLSVTNEQGSLCELSKGTPITVNKVLGTYSTANECAQACKSKKSCLIWHFDRKSDECRIVKLKINDDKQGVFGFSLCNTTIQPSTLPGLGLCSGYFDSNTGTCYTYKVFTGVNRNWTDSRSQCQAAGGDLADIRSTNEWESVKEVLSESYSTAFLGGSDAQEEGNWVWTDGSPVTFSDWETGRPLNDTYYNCMVASYYYSWRWVDDPCDTYYSDTLCKIPELSLQN